MCLKVAYWGQLDPVLPPKLVKIKNLRIKVNTFLLQKYKKLEKNRKHATTPNADNDDEPLTAPITTTPSQEDVETPTSPKGKENPKMKKTIRENQKNQDQRKTR